MKRILLLLVGFISSLCIWADDIKFGFTSDINSNGNIEEFHLISYDDGDNITTNDVTLTKVRGTQSTGTNKGSCFWGSTTSRTIEGVCERTQYGGNALTAENVNAWVGAKIIVPTGYKLNVSSFQIDIAGQDYDFGYHAVVIDGDGDELYTLSSHGTPKQSGKLQITSNDALTLTGEAYVKVYYWLINSTSNSKYFHIPELYITGSVALDVKTNYSKPTLTQGSYSQASAMYPVTLTVQSGEDGTITYQIGDEAEVTGVSSGTIVNVAPNTTIRAKVTGASYGDSQYQTLTTSGMPKLDTPTYTIGSYDMSKNVYTVDLATANGTLMYSINGGTESEYSSTLKVSPGAEFIAYATQTNNENSDNLIFTVPGAPVGGTFTTPSDGGYSDGKAYKADAFTINNTVAYIGGSISSGSSALNGAIKMRIGRTAGTHTGFRLEVNSGYTITSVKAQMFNNYDTKVACTGIYVDGSETNLLSSPVDIIQATANASDIAVAKADGFNATSTIDFAFGSSTGSTDTPNQAQVLISVTYKVVGTGTLGSVSGFEYGFATLSAPRNFVISNANVYKANVVYNTNTFEDEIKLTEVEGVIPANSGVIIAGVPGTTFDIAYVADDATADMSENELYGNVNRTQTSELAGSAVLLAMQKSEATFKEYAGQYFPACRAYLLSDGAAGAKGISLFFDWNDETPTAVAEVESAQDVKNGVKKVIKDGRLLIETTDGEFSIVGARIK